MVADCFVSRKAHPNSDKLTFDFWDSRCRLAGESTKMTNLIGILFQTSHQQGFAWSLWFQAGLRSTLSKQKEASALPWGVWALPGIVGDSASHYNGPNSTSTRGHSTWLNLTLHGLLDSRRASRGRDIGAWRFFSEKSLLEEEMFFTGYDLLIDIPVLTQFLREAFHGSQKSG